MEIEQVVRRIKTEFEQAVTTGMFDGRTYPNGSKSKEALIRSQRLIKYLHEFIKTEFIRCNVNPDRICPRLNDSKPEIAIQGHLKAKRQDICITPNTTRILNGDILPASEIEKVITINVRSQLSSISANIDTLYERTFAEPLNLHLKYPRQCLGDVYLIPTHGYNRDGMLENRIAFQGVTPIETYIKLFQQINNRQNTNTDQYKYERACLLIVDFRQTEPVVYSSINDLANAGLISSNTTITMDRLTIGSFAQELIDIYATRFSLGLLS